MKQTLLITIILLLTPFVLLAQDQDVKADKEAIQQVIQTAYVDGIANHGNIEDIENGFHPGFNLLGIRDNTLSKFPIYSWIYYVQKDKAENPDPPEEPVSVEYEMIDVTGTAAIAKLKYMKGGKQLYTDYLSLYKFADGWKIVNKIYFKHE